MDDREPIAPEPAEDDDLFETDGEKEEVPPRGQHLDADSLLDKVIPGEIDWRDIVRRHPVVSVGVAAGLGFLVGRSKGAAIISGASAAVTGAVMRQLSDVFDGDIFEF